MAKKEKIKKHSFEWYHNVFNEIKEDDQSRELNKKLYEEIYKFYEKKKDLDINIERITLKRKIGNYKGLSTTFNLQLVVVALTILMNASVQVAGATFQSQLGFTGSIGCYLVSIIIFFYIVKESIKSKSSEKDFVWYLSLQALDDIEKARELEKAKDKAEKLKIQQRNEQYFNAQDEVAVTYDRIIDNTQNDKKNKGNGKCIKGFINIINNKIYSK